MKLYCLTKTRDNGKSPLKAKWDVVAIGHTDAGWGTEEVKTLQLVEVDTDDLLGFPPRWRLRLIELAGELDDKKAAGLNPIIEYPFKKTIQVRNEANEFETQVEQISQIQFDLDDLTDEERKQRIARNDIEEPPIPHTESKTLFKERQEVILGDR